MFTKKGLAFGVPQKHVDWQVCVGVGWWLKMNIVAYDHRNISRNIYDTKLGAFLPESNGLDVFDGVKSSFLEVKTVYMILGILVFWSSIDYYFSAK